MHLALYVVLGLSIAVDLALGAWASVAWESFASTWFPSATELGREPRLLGLVLGLILIFFAVMQALALRWIRTEREGGFHFVICFGGYLVVSSIVVLAAAKTALSGVLQLGGVEFVLIDGLRGAALVTFGLLAMNAPATVRELRIPEHARQHAVRTHAEERSHRGRSGDDRSQRRGGRGRSNRDRSANRAAGVDSRAERSGHRDSRGERSGAGGSQNRDRRSGGGGGRDARRPRSEKPEAPRTPEATASDPEADRSLAVVVRGEFRGGESGGSRSGESARESEPSGDRRRRRRGGRGRRRDNSRPASASGTSTEEGGPAPSSMRSASAGPDAIEIGRSAHGGTADMVGLLGRSPSVSDPQSGSEFGRSRRPSGARRR